MKFFTREVYATGHLDDPAPLTQLYQRYRDHLASLEGRAPSTVLALALLNGIDDGLVIDAGYSQDRRDLHLTLRCGDLQIGYFDLVLHYRDARVGPRDALTLARVARTTKDDSRFASDLWVQELDCAEDGHIIHRLAFHCSFSHGIRVMEITCRELEWCKVPRPDRSLPRRRDRFPDGPRVLLPSHRRRVRAEPWQR